MKMKRRLISFLVVFAMLFALPFVTETFVYANEEDEHSDMDVAVIYEGENGHTPQKIEYNTWTEGKIILTVDSSL